MVQTAACVENEASEAPQAAAPVPAIDEGLLSLAMIAAFYRIASDPAQMAHDLSLGHSAARAEDIVRAARRIGLKAHALHEQTAKRSMTCARRTRRWTAICGTGRSISTTCWC